MDETNFEESVKKLAEWLKSDEGKAHMEKLVEEVKKMRKELEEASRVPDEILRKRITI